jgi:hypothetical protein
MRTMLVLLVAAVLLSAEGDALGCPFCGGKGASGLLENLLLVAGFWFGARALMRAMRRRRARLRPPETEATDGQ